MVLKGMNKQWYICIGILLGSEKFDTQKHEWISQILKSSKLILDAKKQNQYCLPQRQW